MTYIRCPNYNCTMSRLSCARRYELASGDVEAVRLRIIECYGCDIGAAHAAGELAGVEVEPPAYVASHAKRTPAPAPKGYQRRRAKRAKKDVDGNDGEA